jgi:hypothetical protein
VSSDKLQGPQSISGWNAIDDRWSSRHHEYALPIECGILRCFGNFVTRSFAFPEDKEIAFLISASSADGTQFAMTLSNEPVS